jgi:hypothetical protein
VGRTHPSTSLRAGFVRQAFTDDFADKSIRATRLEVKIPTLPQTTREGWGNRDLTLDVSYCFTHLHV